MGKTRKISWKAFDKMTQDFGAKTGQTFGIEHRVFFVEIISPLAGSIYVRIPRDFALMSPKPTKNVYKVSEAYSTYYSNLQNQLKGAPLPVLSNDGEFLISATEVFTFIKNLSLAKGHTISQAVEDIKMATGVDISDEDESSSSSSSSDEKEEGLIEEGLEEDKGTVIEFDSDDEIEDYFENQEKTSTKSKPQKPPKTPKVEHEAFHVGVIYPMLQLKEFFKKVRDREIEKYETLAKENVEKFEKNITQDMVSQIDRVLDSLRDRMALKISEFAKEERSIQKNMTDTRKVLRGAQQILIREMAVDPKKLQEKIVEAKSDLRELYIKLTQVKEDTRRTLREFLAALEEIE